MHAFKANASAFHSSYIVRLLYVQIRVGTKQHSAYIWKLACKLDDDGRTNVDLRELEAIGPNHGAQRSKGEKAVLLVWSLRGSDHTFQLWQLPQLTTPSVLVRGEASPGSRRCHHQYLMGSLSLRTVMKQWFMKDLGKIVVHQRLASPLVLVTDHDPGFDRGDLWWSLTGGRCVLWATRYCIPSLVKEQLCGSYDRRTIYIYIYIAGGLANTFDSEAN
jgi:hypothetical protein